MDSNDISYPAMPDKRKGTALYYQVAEIIRAKVQNGEWKTGAKLPSEPDLALQLHVSRATVRQAISELTQKGMLVRRHGSGTYVSRPSFTEDFLQLTYPKELGCEHKMIARKETVCSQSIAQLLEMPPDTPINEIVWLRCLSDGTKAGLERFYLPKELYLDLEKSCLKDRFRTYLEKEYKLEITKIKNWLEPVLLEQSEAELLGEKAGNPALLVTRINYTYRNKPIYVVKNLIRAEISKYLIVT